MDAGELPLSGPEMRVLIAIGALLRPSNTHELADGMQVATARVEQLARTLQSRGLASFDEVIGWRLSAAGLARVVAEARAEKPQTGGAAS